MGISVFAEGMYLIGVPDIDDVQKVMISYSEITSEIKEFSDAERIELAVKLTGFFEIFSYWKSGWECLSPDYNNLFFGWWSKFIGFS